MNKVDLLNKITTLTLWKKGDLRAPHKPLLLLYALAKLLNNGTSKLTFQEAKEPLTKLLKDFGPYRKSYHPEQPFARLANDGLWSLTGDTPIDTKNPKSSKLITQHATGAFTKDVEFLLLSNQSLIVDIATYLLDDNFPPSIHQDILDAVGLQLEVISKIRDSKFREKIMIAYEYQCAICGFNVQMGSSYVALDAAHIKWKKAYGPDIEQNGLLLCTMHHKLFDRGALTIGKEMEILVSDQAHGTHGFQDWLMKFHGQKIRLPQRQTHYPELKYTEWHVKEVFHGEYRSP